MLSHMDSTFKQLAGLMLTLAILVATFFIAERFIAPLAWSAIIVIATFPLYRKLCQLLGQRHLLAATCITLLIALIIAIPLSWLVTSMVHEAKILFHFLDQANQKGQSAPAWLGHIPMVGDKAISFWQESLGKPGGLNMRLSEWQVHLHPATDWFKRLSSAFAHHGMTLFFTLLCSFFLYKDGDKLSQQIHRVGNQLLPKRWALYADHLPAAIRATVNGTVFTGFGVGFFMGIGYFIAGVPTPIIFAFITAIAAMIPFAAAIIFLIIAAILLTHHSILSVILLLIWGFIVTFVADHFVKPKLIGSATALPFLAVLFGVLGGVETLGLIGLFIGPVIMIFFITLWQELQGSP